MNKIAITAIAVTVGFVAGAYANHLSAKKAIKDSQEANIAYGEELGRDAALNDLNAVAEAYERLNPQPTTSRKK